MSSNQQITDDPRALLVAARVSLADLEIRIQAARDPWDSASLRAVMDEGFALVSGLPERLQGSNDPFAGMVLPDVSKMAAVAKTCSKTIKANDDFVLIPLRLPNGSAFNGMISELQNLVSTPTIQE